MYVYIIIKIAEILFAFVSFVNKIVHQNLFGFFHFHSSSPRNTPMRASQYEILNGQRLNLKKMKELKIVQEPTENIRMWLSLHVGQCERGNLDRDASNCQHHVH